MAGQHVQANLINEKGDNSKKTDLKSEDEILDKIAQTPTEIKLKDDKEIAENSDKKPDQAKQNEGSGNALNARNGSNTNGEKPVQSYLALTSLGMGKKDATKPNQISPESMVSNENEEASKSLQNQSTLKIDSGKSSEGLRSPADKRKRNKTLKTEATQGKTYMLGYIYSKYTRKYPLRGYILGVLTHTTALDRLWGGDETLTMWF